MAKLKDGMTDEEKVEYATAVLEQLYDSIFAYNYKPFLRACFL